MKRIIISLAILLGAITISAQKVNVAAAANLKFVLEEIKTAYLKHLPTPDANFRNRDQEF